ncbi:MULTISPECIES: amidohydrolase [unclassified Ornithinimicrobium]|uniref:amidohydrolase n=1 Tax=unclassified Ornithinimicrobium TaxID=2615080 RepID=UPI0038541B41
MSAVTRALEGLDETSAWQEELYKHLHAHPELSFQEVQTRAEIVRRLGSDGYEVQEIGGGVVGVMRNGEGPTVLFRADIDALPVTEATGLDYASTVTATDADGRTVGVMHACGHDSHIACALGAASLLSEHRDVWAGTYVALFQPAEELGAGARAMVDDGLVDKVPHPDVCLGQHVLAAPEAGHVGTMAGPVLSAGDSLRITVHGKGSHGSMPHLGVDPVVVAAAIVMRLQTVVARELAPGDFGVVTVGSVQAGHKANIIPAEAVLLVNTRAYDEGVRATIMEAIERIVRAECAAAGCPQEPGIEVLDSFPLTDNDPVVTETVTRALVAHLGEDRVHELGRIPASEDFSVIPDAFGVPYTYWGYGGFTPDMDAVPNHNPAFAPAVQPVLRTGTEAAVVAVLAYLGTEEQK